MAHNSEKKGKKKVKEREDYGGNEHQHGVPRLRDLGLVRRELLGRGEGGHRGAQREGVGGRHGQVHELLAAAIAREQPAADTGGEREYGRTSSSEANKKVIIKGERVRGKRERENEYYGGGWRRQIEGWRVGVDGGGGLLSVFDGW